MISTFTFSPDFSSISDSDTSSHRRSIQSLNQIDWLNDISAYVHVELSEVHAIIHDALKSPSIYANQCRRLGGRLNFAIGAALGHTAGRFTPKSEPSSSDQLDDLKRIAFVSVNLFKRCGGDTMQLILKREEMKGHMRRLNEELIAWTVANGMAALFDPINVEKEDRIDEVDDDGQIVNEGTNVLTMLQRIANKIDDTQRDRLKEEKDREVMHKQAKQLDVIISLLRQHAANPGSSRTSQDILNIQHALDLINLEQTSSGLSSLATTTVLQTTSPPAFSIPIQVPSRGSISSSSLSSFAYDNTTTGTPPLEFMEYTRSNPMASVPLRNTATNGLPIPVPAIQQPIAPPVPDSPFRTGYPSPSLSSPTRARHLVATRYLDPTTGILTDISLFPSNWLWKAPIPVDHALTMTDRVVQKDSNLVTVCLWTPNTSALEKAQSPEQRFVQRSEITFLFPNVGGEVKVLGLYDIKGRIWVAGLHRSNAGLIPLDCLDVDSNTNWASRNLMVVMAPIHELATAVIGFIRHSNTGRFNMIDGLLYRAFFRYLEQGTWRYHLTGKISKLRKGACGPVTIVQDGLEKTIAVKLPSVTFRDESDHELAFETELARDNFFDDVIKLLPNLEHAAAALPNHAVNGVGSANISPIVSRPGF